ncbi:MAG TPA: SAM-dependent methyltransferase [Mycobacteriales bacterium]|nr:SAM-dependent methyltransferase [Mycobacteriales bacterium]
MTLPESYFDRVYDAARDPWSFETRWYERRKYALTIASLPKPRYLRCFEAGCSIGVLTSMLAPRCVSLLAADITASSVVATRQRLEGRPGVTVEQLTLPADWPDGSFDLIVLSEIGYYLAKEDLDELVTRATESLEAGGTLIAVHWRHGVADYPLRGEDVHEVIEASPYLERLARHDEEDFLLEVFARDRAVSVARATGLLT